MSGAPNAAAHLRALTGLRFVAAFWVLIYHAMPREMLPTPVRALAAGGFLGVGLFFVLSGFILAHVYGASAAAGTLSARPFWRARFARIYPVYVAALVFAIPLLMHDVALPGAPRGATLTGICAANITMLQAWIPGWGCVWNCPGWSLSAEAFFYLLFPVLAPWVLRQERSKLWWIACACVVSLVGIGLWLDTPADAFAYSPTGSGLSALVSAWTPLLRLPEFVLGICAARLAQGEGGYRGAHRGVTAAATAAFVGIVIVSDGWSSGLLRVAAVTAPVAAMIASLASPTGPSLLSSALMVRLGNASYSLYLLHAVSHSYFLAVANRTLGRPWAQGWTAFFVYALGAVVLSLIVHDRIELPLRRALRPAAARAPSAATAW